MALRKWILLARSSNHNKVLSVSAPQNSVSLPPSLSLLEAMSSSFSTPYFAFLPCCRYKRGSLARSSEGMQVVRLRMTVWWLLIFLALVQFPEATNGQSKYLCLMVSLLAFMSRFSRGFLSHLTHHVGCSFFVSYFCITLIKFWLKEAAKPLQSGVYWLYRWYKSLTVEQSLDSLKKEKKRETKSFWRT